MDKQKVIFRDLGIIEYKSAWDHQENLLQENVRIKSAMRNAQFTADGQSSFDIAGDIHLTPHMPAGPADSRLTTPDSPLTTTNYFLICEHPPVYTLGKSGKKEHVLMSDDELAANGIAFFNTNRGGDITFHGLQQLVGYPILDLEKYYTDIGTYLRNLEEMIILTIAEYGISGGRSKGETGVWIDAGIPEKERKICAIGVRCSRWITMHGFAMNVNTDLAYFNNIIPCGIQNKQVTSIKKELGHEVDYDEVKAAVKRNFEKVFDSVLLG